MVYGFFLDHPCVQVDSIDVAGTNHDFTLFSRVEDYKRRYLEGLLYQKRELFEYFCKMMSILPVETYPLFKHKMVKFRIKYETFFDEHRKEIDQIMDAAEDGPICSRDLKDMGETEWGWGRKTRISNKLLTRLWVAGKLMVHHREGRIKYYTMPEKVIPEKHLTMEPPDEDGCLKELALMIVRSSSIVSPSKAPEQWNEIGKTREVRTILKELERDGKVFQIDLDGWNTDVYCPTEDEDIWTDIPEIKDQFVRFLSPLDPVLWNRSLFKSIFENEYVWEIYKKKEDRKYGYYCLPIIYNGDYVGLIEPYLRNDGVLDIRSFHLFDDISEDEVFLELLKNELEWFMDYLEVKEIEDKSDHVSINKILLK